MNLLKELKKSRALKRLCFVRRQDTALFKCYFFKCVAHKCRVTFGSALSYIQKAGLLQSRKARQLRGHSFSMFTVICSDIIFIAPEMSRPGQVERLAFPLLGCSCIAISRFKTIINFQATFSPTRDWALEDFHSISSHKVWWKNQEAISIGDPRFLTINFPGQARRAYIRQYASITGECTVNKLSQI